MNILKIKPMIVKTDDYYKNSSNNLNLINNELQKSLNEEFELCFNIQGMSSKFSYGGIKLIINDAPNFFIKKLLNSDSGYSNILVNNVNIKNKNIFHINDFTKISDILSTKKNGILHEYLKLKGIASHDLNFQDYLVKTFFELKDLNLERLNSVSFKNASILDYLEISGDFLNKSTFKNFLNIIKDDVLEKQLVIINDCNLLPLEEIVNEYAGKINFLIFTNNPYKWINDTKFIDLVIIIDSFVNEKFKTDSLELVDKDSFINYLEKNLKYTRSKIIKYVETIKN